VVIAFGLRVLLQREKPKPGKTIREEDFGFSVVCVSLLL